ncbi:hypothetical protein Gasu2_65530 [Galdieria sulphuraria]|nr:hypothetical protein Gasu2_65530 [Galdieria sulphuraria]
MRRIAMYCLISTGGVVSCSEFQTFCDPISTRSQNLPLLASQKPWKTASQSVKRSFSSFSGNNSVGFLCKNYSLSFCAK